MLDLGKYSQFCFRLDSITNKPKCNTADGQPMEGRMNENTKKKRNIRFCHHIVILFFLPHFHHSSQTNININLSVRCTHTIKTVLQCSFAKHFLAISWNEVYLLQTHTYVCMWVCVLCVCKHFIRPTFSWSNICTHALTLFVLLYVAAGEFWCFLFVW